jgi:hypothetical protein
VFERVCNYCFSYDSVCERERACLRVSGSVVVSVCWRVCLRVCLGVCERACLRASGSVVVRASERVWESVEQSARVCVAVFGSL